MTSARKYPRPRALWAVAIGTISPASVPPAGVWPLPGEHRGGVAAWVALHLLRGSSVRNSMSELASHALLLDVILGGRTRLREALIAAGEPVDDDRVNREWVRLFKFPFRAEARAEHHMQHLADLLPRVTQSLLDRSWLLTEYERKALATSDHPVYVVPNEELTRMGMGTGIENATVIHAPLTRRHSLAMYQPSAVPTQLAALGPRHSLAGGHRHGALQRLLHREQRPPVLVPSPRRCATCRVRPTAAARARGHGQRPAVGLDRRGRPPGAPGGFGPDDLAALLEQ